MGRGREKTKKEEGNINRGRDVSWGNEAPSERAIKAWGVFTPTQPLVRLRLDLFDSVLFL